MGGHGDEGGDVGGSKGGVIGNGDITVNDVFTTDATELRVSEYCQFDPDAVAVRSSFKSPTVGPLYAQL